ncbi:MAG: flagellar hook-basal body complex protein [Pseudobutyrivibrio sp.]|nr:flagellar hook-basal body complex protein [Pseudobutyrivibrio sp.]
MMRSLFSGVAGLKTHQTKMDVIGNNISNVNTVAFKSSSTTFADIMYQTTQQASGATATRGGTNAKQIGLGVTNGATKISITSGGAAQSTGDALDIRLTDSNSTNFFIVSNGTENLFTRAGSFYIDGAGNLAMTTTGYLVMGWQVDTSTGEPIIVKDTVSPLRVMQPANLTSDPEATTDANFSGIIDKNDKQFQTTNGYARSLTFYDNLGYSYTAKFALRLLNADEGQYSIELTNVLDQDNNDLLAKYINAGNDIQNIFGSADGVTTEYKVIDAISNTSVGGVDGIYYKDPTTNQMYRLNGAEMDDTVVPPVKLGYTFISVDENGVQTGQSKTLSLQEVFGVDDVIMKGARNVIETSGIDVANPASLATARLSVTNEGYGLQFDTSEGFIVYAGQPGSMALNLNTALLGPNYDDAALSNISIDFSQLKNFDNGGTSTVDPKRGQAASPTIGAGKKLGTMTGLSISQDGKIYGSYSNGNTVLLGQIAVAQFANASGLEERGDNCYQTTLNSGEFDGIGIDISADGSSMNTGQLEMSNVDLSAEFTDMITTQRGFQANSRIITVSDTMLEELINLKR